MTGFELKKARLYFGLTQSELAKTIGITQPTLAKLEGRENDIKMAYCEMAYLAINKLKMNRIEKLQSEIEYVIAL